MTSNIKVEEPQYFQLGIKVYSAVFLEADGALYSGWRIHVCGGREGG